VQRSVGGRRHPPFGRLRPSAGRLTWSGSRRRSRVAPARSPPPATTGSLPACGRPVWVLWPISSSSAWTTTLTTQSSSPADGRPAAIRSPTPRRRLTGWSAASERRTSTTLPTEELADPHQGPHERATRDHPPARPPRADERRDPALTDDHLPPIARPTGTSTSAPAHAQPRLRRFPVKGKVFGDAGQVSGCLETVYTRFGDMVLHGHGAALEAVGHIRKHGGGVRPA
jgi:hypothetical protein